MYELLKTPPTTPLTRPDSIEYHRVFDTIRETGETHFLHGVAVEQWRGRLAVCFAFNDHAENSITERLMIRWSDDGGRSWGPVESISQPAPYANSHSVFLPREDGLWCFGPRFLGLGERPRTKKGHLSIHFRDLQMEAWKYDGEVWQSMGVVVGDCWPLSAPVRLDNGNYLISGCDTDWLGAVALSRGDDLTHWDVIKPDTDGEVFTEAGAWADGNRVMLVLRNGTAKVGDKYHAAVAFSTDFGRTFGPCELSNLPMATTKPFCGYLDDGRPYLVFNESVDGNPHDRSRLLLGTGEKGSFSITRLYLIDEGQPTAAGRRLLLSYPYARQIGDKLYVAYSSESTPGRGANNNDAMLAVIDVKSLQ